MVRSQADLRLGRCRGVLGTNFLDSVVFGIPFLTMDGTCKYI